MPQILASTNNNLPQSNQGSKEPGGKTKTSRLACRICREIGHLSEECQEQCHHCNTSHSTKECPTTMDTCFLCDGTNHVPRKCKFYFTVQQMNQQAKDKLSHLLEGHQKTEDLNQWWKQKTRRRLIRLKHIYNFWCSMLVFTPFALCFITLSGTFMHFPELTY
jgi:hypothetical protein